MPGHPATSSSGCPEGSGELISLADDGQLFLYPGSQHYFADSALPSYDPDATALLIQRVLDFLR